MKRLLLLVLPVVLILSSCFWNNYSNWDGSLEGKEGLYNLEIKQDGKDLVFTVQVNDEKYGELLAGLKSGETFTPPSELFIWMAPTFGNFYGGGEDGTQGNPYRMFPVARKKITPAFFADSEVAETGTVNTNPKTEIRVNLARLANDWNMDWLRPEHFDGQSDDDMNGVYGFAADNYFETWDEWISTSIKSADGNTTTFFRFQKSRPLGTGYSPAASILGNDWVPVTIAAEGLRISSEYIFGGEPFTVTLKLVNDDTLSGSIFIPAEDYGSFELTAYNVHESSDIADKLYIWKISYETADLVDGDPWSHGVEDSDGIIRLRAPAISYNHSLGYSWYSAWFHYMGYPERLFSTDFEAGFNLAGSVGGVFNQRVETSHPYGGTIPDSGNNWGTGASPVGYGGGASGQVLGTGSGGTISNYYDNWRNDTLELPAVNYSSHTFFGQSVYVSFDLYKNLDFNWSDSFCVEIELWDSYWDGSEYIYYPYWSEVQSWWGPKDVSGNNGWSRVTLELGNYLFTVDKQHKIRLRFTSDGYNTSDGVYIDNFSVAVMAE